MGKEVKERRETMWNLGKPGGWNRYHVLTEEEGMKVEKIAGSENTVEEKYHKFVKLHDKIKFRAFGKMNIKKKKDDLDNNEKKDAKEIFEEQSKRAADEIEEIKGTQHSKAGKVCEIK